MSRETRAARLSALARSRSATQATRPGPRPVDVKSALKPFIPPSGAEAHTSRGCHWEIREPPPAQQDVFLNDAVFPVREDKDLARLGGVGPSEVAIFDLETCGFAGNPAFLIGVMAGTPPGITQYFARHYGEEASMLEAALQSMSAYPVWISFNGKSYDLPFLRDRAVRHRLPFSPPATHVDLMHPARRKWKGAFPDCRLQTLERHILGHIRHGDIGGREIPAVYHAYVQGRRAADLLPVLRHNRQDLQSLAGLLSDLLEKPPRAITGSPASR